MNASRDSLPFGGIWAELALGMRERWIGKLNQQGKFAKPNLMQEAEAKKPALTTRQRGRPTLAETSMLTERILEVAERHFLQLGYDKTKIDEIAIAAGVAKGALYLRYPDKTLLFAEVCTRFVANRYRSDIKNLADDLPMRESLRRQANALIAAATDPTTLAFFAMIVAGQSRHPKIAQANQKIWDFYIANISGYFNNRIDRKLLRLSDPVMAAELFAGMVFSLLHVSVLHGLPLPSAAQLDDHVVRVVLLFLGGIGRLEVEGPGNDAG